MTYPPKVPKFTKDLNKPLVGEPASQPEGAVIGIDKATDPEVFAKKKGYSFVKPIKTAGRRHKKRSQKRKTHRRRR